MTFFALLGHLLNFFDPALVMALLLWGLLCVGHRSTRGGRWGPRNELLSLMALGAMVLLAGLVYFGRDGKMLTYAALVLAQGSLAWWVRRGR